MSELARLRFGAPASLLSMCLTAAWVEAAVGIGTSPGLFGDLPRALLSTGATALMRAGLTRSTLRPGEEVIVTGSPSRNASAHKLIMRRIVRPSDGWEWGGVVD